jgi:malic enzyme
VEKDLREAALEYHRWPTPGKISVRPTKGLTNQRDLALAYSPGVAAACDAIVEDPATAADTPRAPTWSASSPTALPSSASAISARWPPSR